MKLTLFGAAGGVTGSSYYIQSDQSSVMVDCGSFQGKKETELKNRKAPPVDYHNLDAILLTHAHLDHCGRLPLAIKQGYSGPIYGTPATLDISALILRDAMKIQTNDFEKLNRMLLRNGKPQVEPPYLKEHVEEAIRLMKPMPYHKIFEVAKGISVMVDEAGHIMGSGSLLITVEEDRKTKSILFSGDLGPYGMPIVRDAEPFLQADVVIMESTYGDRDHKPFQATLEEASTIIKEAVANKGKILVPSFAIGRTQDILYFLEHAFAKGDIPIFPVYIDSPMAIEATKIYTGHPELFDEDMIEFSKTGELLKYKDFIHPTPTPEESKKLNDVQGPCMIIAGSGMCNAGRIKHHLRHNLWKPDTSVLIVGYQAEGTLGRQLVDGAKWVNIFGERIAVRAQIHKLGGFSAHAGQSDLLKWFNAIAPARPKLILAHGEDHARITLAKLIKDDYGIEAWLPNYGESMII
ncbi:MAG: MBL fold metallo-hydrolase [Bacteroidales bacterium]|nr:MBL fold metallo-hydrolase [Bacteroidales bacterium]MDD4602824.1 MBL fold metallo-hydrolase [Bacteroidales bacterium]